MSALDTNLLAELVRVKRQRLLELRTISVRQGELIAHGRITALLDLLAIKQRVLLNLQQIGQALQPFQGQRPEERRWASPELRAQCADHLAECEKLLEEILQREKACELDLARQRDDTAHQIQGMHAAGRAREAYLPHTQRPMSRLDLFTGDH